MPSCAAERQHSAVIEINVRAADIRLFSYNSCRNRHCPKCQTSARNKWLTARQRELLPVDYYHLVFSVPHALVPLIWQNKKLLFRLLFGASAETLAARSGGRSQAPRSRGRLPEYPPHLGTDPAPASPHSLCRAGRRFISGWAAVDPITAALFSAGESAQSGLSRQVRRRPQARISAEEARVSWRLPCAAE